MTGRVLKLGSEHLVLKNAASGIEPRALMARARDIRRVGGHLRRPARRPLSRLISPRHLPFADAFAGAGAHARLSRRYFLAALLGLCVLPRAPRVSRALLFSRALSASFSPPPLPLPPPLLVARFLARAFHPAEAPPSVA